VLDGYSGGVLDRGQADELAAWLDAPRRRFGVEVTAPATRQDPGTGERIDVGRRGENVWHCSLSIAAPEGALGDERWRVIAGEFADAMGLTEASGKAPCRWVAIHHGTSKNGNDHIHLVASTVREDGTRWEGRYRDHNRAQAACRALEERHGLVRLTGPASGSSERGSTRAEIARAARAGAELTAPQELGQRVRAAAAASTSEAEFVRRVRGQQIVIKPRYAKDSTTEVVGYRVALRPEANAGEWTFYAGGTLGRDLRLPELRKTWTTTAPEHAVAEWRATHTGRGVAETAGREARELAAGAERLAAQRWAAFNERLATLPHTDKAGWADAARQTSAALAAWRSPEATRAARVLARSARVEAIGQPGPAGAATVVLLARTGRAGPATTDLGRELDRSVELIRTHHTAVGNTAEATRIAAVPGMAITAPVRVAGRIRAAARAAERLVDHGR
jgi:hypothetical protein